VYLLPDAKRRFFRNVKRLFLAQAGIRPNQQDRIEGAQVFGLYADLIQNRRKDFIDQKVSLKTIQGILSRFVFSIFDDEKGKTRKKLLPFANPQKFKLEDDGRDTVFGYLYLDHYASIYDEIAELREQQFDNFDHSIL